MSAYRVTLPNLPPLTIDAPSPQDAALRAVTRHAPPSERTRAEVAGHGAWIVHRQELDGATHWRVDRPPNVAASDAFFGIFGLYRE